MMDMSEETKGEFSEETALRAPSESVFRASPFQFTLAGQTGSAVLDVTQVLSFGASDRPLEPSKEGTGEKL